MSAEETNSYSTLIALAVYANCRGKTMTDELDEKEKLLQRAGSLLNSIISGLDAIDLETRRKIMESCGEARAQSDGDLQIANIDQLGWFVEDERLPVNRQDFERVCREGV